ncbi:hypothetical protein BURK2_01888 [Burkholderiales bacterium]|nr:hypothetical protein BURK2_01888 [Burkholderiales bacterium]
MALRFVETESAFAYFAATQGYLERHGKPAAFYSDKHSVFRVNQPGAVGGDGMAQFGRCLRTPNIDIICANSPQAKGRVERANKTLQDRLAKELRLQGIGSLAAGNAMLPAFMADYNARFAKPPRDPKDLHRPLAPGEDLGEVFARREERTVSGSLALQYDKVLFLPGRRPSPRASSGKGPRWRTTRTGGSKSATAASTCPTVFCSTRSAKCPAGRHRREQAPGAVLAHIRAGQQADTQRGPKAPKRRSQTDHMFKTG